MIRNLEQERHAGDTAVLHLCFAQEQKKMDKAGGTQGQEMRKSSELYEGRQDSDKGGKEKSLTSRTKTPQSLSFFC